MRLKRIFLAAGILVPLFLALLSGCASVPPRITSESGKTYYISPKNGDGIQDVLSVPIAIEAAKKHVIRGYRITVTGEDGAVVREEITEAPSLKFFKKLGTALGFVKKEGAELPKVLLWNGRNDSEEFVPDGRYRVAVNAWDDKKRTVNADPIDVVVDNTPPEITVSVPYRVFSPNSDGNKDTLPISQNSSGEDKWEGFIKDGSGRTVLTYSWAGKPPLEILWDGAGSDGTPAPDGLYSYTVMSTDRAGNTGSDRIENIGINTAPTPVSITADLDAFSPNGDGVQDVVRISPLFPPEGLDGWIIEIFDSSSERVRRLRGTEQAVFTWDGTGEDGALLPDGSYTAELDVLYENGNNPHVTGGPIVIDTIFPVLRFSADFLLFSPDSDGKKDFITIRQADASTERVWTGTVLQSGNTPVLRKEWTGVPDDFTWDGKNDRGTVVADGAYTYRISSVDEAGNAFSADLPGIRVDTRPVQINIRPSVLDFSPNNDGIKDSITFYPEASYPEAVESWLLSIQNSRGTAVKTERGASLNAYTWNGLMDDKTYAKDGAYTLTYEVLYVKGNNPTVRTGTFYVDTGYPYAKLAADYTLFSPDGDGLRDTIIFKSQAATAEDEWKGEVLDSANAAVKSVSWKGVPKDLVWDGKDDQGKTAADGMYTYRLSSADKAGNFFQTQLKGIRIDTRPTPAAVRLSDSAFSPNKDGILDTVTILPEAEVTEGIVDWTLVITDKAGTAVVSKRNTGKPAPFVWNGITDKNTPAADGEYSVAIQITYEKGASPAASAGPLTLDTVPPSASVSASYLLFSPDGDGRRDVMQITQKTSSEAVWLGSVYNAAGSKVREFSWNGKAGDLAWDGKDGTGGAAGDGRYAYVLKAADAAGNTGAAEILNIVIDTRKTSARILNNASGFSPNGDGVKDLMSFSTFVGLREGILNWSVSAVDAAADTVIPIRSGRMETVPDTVAWTGKNASGVMVKEGNYYAQIQIEYEKGNLVQERSAAFILDVSPPKTSISLAPLPFSPDGDGENDTVAITLNAADASPIQEWELQLFDPAGNLFAEFAQSGAPDKPIIWNGKSRTGELVQSASDYAIAYKVKDILGNTAAGKDVLPVDILVIRDGDRLKIQISSIYFAPYTAEFQPGKEADNLKTLQRLSEILKKFAAYQISVEGHAVRIYWYDEVQGRAEEQEVLAPLSLSRAEKVKTILTGYGIPASRMTTLGFGGMRPVVPHSDLDNRWKNRRVEFILRKK